MMVSFCAVLFPRDVLDDILDLIESVSEGFPTYSYIYTKWRTKHKISDIFYYVRDRKIIF